MNPDRKPMSQRVREWDEKVRREGLHLSPEQTAMLLEQLDAVEDAWIEVWSVLMPDESPLFAPESKQHRDIPPSAPRP